MLKSKFTGETMIFAKDFGERTAYSTSLSNKKQDGTYEKAYIGVQFKRGVVVENKEKINILNGWLKFYINKEGKPVWGIFVNEFERVESSDDPMDNFEALDEATPF